MIENPNLKTVRAAGFPEIIHGEPEDDILNMKKRQGRIAVKRMLGAKYADPGRFDQQFESVVKEVQTEIIEVDAKLMEGGRLVHYRDAAAFLKSPTVRRRIEKAMKLRRLTEAESDKASDTLRKHSLQARMGARLRENRKARESSFEYGLYPDEVFNGTGTRRVLYGVR